MSSKVYNSSNISHNPKILREASLVEPIVRNPFVHHLKFTWYDKIKIGFNAVFLLPIRVCVITTLTLICIGFGFVMTVGLNEEDLTMKPLKGWRKKLKGVLRFLGRSIAFCFGFHSIKKNGVRATRQEAPIFVAAPHSSFLDAFVYYVLGMPSIVSRSENKNLPFIGRLVKAAQPIFVTREDSKNKLKTIEEIKKRTNPESDWPQVLIFPEGTTTNRSCLITFKPGAFIPSLPVQPIVVEYKNKLDTITWTWEGLTAVKVIFLTLCQFNNKLEITYLPIYTPNDKEKEDAKLFARNVRAVMAEHLNILTTNHTYEDCRLMLKARELNLPFESGLIEFDKIKEKLNINYDNCQEILKKFSDHAKKSNGKMSLKEFSTYLDLPPTGPVVHVFNLYDRDKDGHIDFREFLIGLSLLSQPVNTEDTLKLAFNMFDENGKGYISLTDLQSILLNAFSMPPEEVEVLFKKIDTKNDGLITYDELKSYAQQKPEYARVFLIYNEIKILRNNIDIEKLATPTSEKENIFSIPDNSQATSISAPTSLLKRPLSDKNKNEIQLNESKSTDKSLDESISVSQNHKGNISKLVDTKND